jgi:hypothetical protein
MDKLPRLLKPINVGLRDPMRHFARDPPRVKLAAWVIYRLPWIITSVGSAGAMVKASGWW